MYMRRLNDWSHIFVLVACAATANLVLGEEQKPLLANGSFEQGQDTPLGWKCKPGGEWRSGAAHRGRRFVRVDGADERGWESDGIPLVKDTDYRLEGWIRAPSG